MHFIKFYTVSETTEFRYRMDFIPKVKLYSRLDAEASLLSSAFRPEGD